MASARPDRLPLDEPTAESVFRAFQLEGFFPEFSAELCGTVFPHSGVHQFRAGEKVIEGGENGRDLYLVLAGRVSADESAFVYRLDYEDVSYLLKNNPALAEHLHELARARTAP